MNVDKWYWDLDTGEYVSRDDLLKDYMFYEEYMEKSFPEYVEERCSSGDIRTLERLLKMVKDEILEGFEHMKDHDISHFDGWENFLKYCAGRIEFAKEINGKMLDARKDG